MDTLPPEKPNVKTALITEMDSRIVELEKEVKAVKRWAMITAGISLLNFAVTKIAHLDARDAKTEQRAPVEASGNTVTIGAAAEQEPPRDFKTVAEFAEISGLAPRTVTTYIAEGRIQPPPVKSGREWIIPATSRIVADGGK